MTTEQQTVTQALHKQGFDIARLENLKTNQGHRGKRYVSLAHNGLGYTAKIDKTGRVNQAHRNDTFDIR